MGTKRVGLARTQALIENLKRELSLNGTALKGIDRVVEAKTADFTVAATDSGKIFTNRGDVNAMAITLPDPSDALKGTEFWTLNVVAQKVEVKTATVDTLITTGDATADSLHTSTIGCWMHCYCDGTSWFAEPTTDGGTYTIVT